MLWAEQLAKSVHRNLPPSFDLDDLKQVAYYALWVRLQEFDASYSVPFQAYAHNYIKSACLYTDATHAELKDRHADERGPGVEFGMLLAQLGAASNRAEENLPERERHVVKEHVVEGRLMTEVAERLALARPRRF